MLKLAKNLEIPEKVATETLAILAKRGKGKTYAALDLAEELYAASVPFVALDPVGVWWGLRLNAKGTGPGYPVTILGGAHGDLPLQDSAGKVIAELAVNQPRPMVLDLSEFNEAEKKRFVEAFASELYRLKASVRTPLMVMLDEADEFCPQRPMAGEQKMLGAVDRMIRRGRARGIGVTLISQRPAAVNKNALTQTEILIAMGLTSPQDRTAIDEWIRANGSEEERQQVLKSLASLKTGEAWVWSPAFLETLKRVTFRKRRTFDSSATPEFGDEPQARQSFAEIDLSELSERMEATIERAKADDPAALRKRIRELEKQLQERPEIPVIPTDLRDIAHKRIQEILDRHKTLVEEFGRMLLSVHELRDAIDTASGDRTDQQKPRSKGAQKGSSAEAKQQPRVRPKPAPTPAGDSGVSLKKGARAILALVNELQPIDRKQVCTLAGITPGSGTASTYVNSLKTAGFVVEEDRALTITEAGVDYLDATGAVSPDTSWDAFVGRFSSKIKAGARRMLEIVRDEGPLTRREVAEKADINPTSGTASTYMNALRRAGLVEIEGSTVTLSAAARYSAERF